MGSGDGGVAVWGRVVVVGGVAGNAEICVFVGFFVVVAGGVFGGVAGVVVVFAGAVLGDA